MNIPIDELKLILTRPGYLSEADFERCGQAATEQKRPIGDLIVEREYLREEQLGQLIAEARGHAFLNLSQEKLDGQVLKQIPEAVARSKQVVAISRHEDEVRVGMVNPDDLETVHSLEKRFSARVKPFYITQGDFRKAMGEYKAGLKEEFGKILGKLDGTVKDGSDHDTLQIRLVDLILEHGHYNHASDIHIESREKALIVRFRIDGVMHSVLNLPVKLGDIILTRIKILAKMRIDEHLSAQDGKFRFFADNQPVDVRVSIIPATRGENIVLRLLSVTHGEISLETLGLTEKDRDTLHRAIKNPHGMILVTGPTGCGKTTTIYEIIKTLNTDEVHIASIEDPVEYDIEGVSQIQVNAKANLTFAKGLRAIVRQDPDIIFVGEIRDNETAGIAVNSALTGHLVLSTLHANDAATAFPRLLDMGIEAFLIASTVRIVIAERLVRKICEKCRFSYILDEAEATTIKGHPELEQAFAVFHQENPNAIRLFKGQGCKVCSQTGYIGRLGIFEIIEMDLKLKNLILKSASSDEIRQAANELGFTTMLEDGINKALKGLTTLEEVLRVVELKQ